MGFGGIAHHDILSLWIAYGQLVVLSVKPEFLYLDGQSQLKVKFNHILYHALCVGASLLVYKYGLWLSYPAKLYQFCS